LAAVMACMSPFGIALNLIFIKDIIKTKVITG
jgi:hypothetical protein